jgi:hypothetical protein
VSCCHYRDPGSHLDLPPEGLTVRLQGVSSFQANTGSIYQHLKLTSSILCNIQLTASFQFPHPRQSPVIWSMFDFLWTASIPSEIGECCLWLRNTYIYVNRIAGLSFLECCSCLARELFCCQSIYHQRVNHQLRPPHYSWIDHMFCLCGIDK